jgi:hypothetical protein
MPSRFAAASASRRALLAAPLLLLAGCGGNDEPRGTATEVSLTADEVLRAASARMAAINTMRFSLDVEGETYVDRARTIQLLSATGELQRPDRVSTEFKVKVLRGLTVTVRMIVIGAERWTTDLITGRWGPAPAEFSYQPSVLFNEQNGLGPIMGAVSGAMLLPAEQLRDRAVHRVQAQVEAAVAGPLTGDTMEGSPVGVDLWIDRATYDLLRAMLTEGPTVQGRTPAVWTLDLTDHDTPLTIAAPITDG